MNIPIYKAKINQTDWETGIYRVSLVEYPATETDWQLFSKQGKPVEHKFSIEDEEKHLVRGVIMLADTPIYRRDGDREYYLEFDKETLRQMAQKMLRFGYQNNLNTDHNYDTFVEGMFLQEIFVKDSERGVNPSGFEDVPEGSLFAVYKVDSLDLWNRIKAGEWSGFSMEAYMDLELVEDETIDEEEQEIFNLIEQLKNKMKN